MPLVALCRPGGRGKRTRVAPARWLAVVLVLLACLGPGDFSPPARAAGSEPASPEGTPAEPPPVDARAVILVDALTGQVLYERNADERLPMASTTKIMTALIAIERGDLNQVITTSEKAWGVEGSSLYLSLGERRTLRELLYGLMLRSGNDAAVAIAEGLAGSVEGFALWMNRRAAELGLRNTHFTDPHGLGGPEHYTSARDLATLTRVAMRNPVFRDIVGTREYRMPWPEKGGERVLYNHNKFLWRYEGATGVKNGYTTAARGALVASAQRDGVELIAVVLAAHPTAMYRDVAQLMDWAYARFEPLTLVTAGETVGEVAVAGGDRVSVSARATQDARLLVVRGSERPALERRVEWRPGLRAPLPAGARVGTLLFLRDGEEVARVPLVSGSAVAAPAGGGPWLAPFRGLLRAAGTNGVALAIGLLLVAGTAAWGAARRARERRRWRRRVTELDSLWYALRFRDPRAG